MRIEEDYIEELTWRERLLGELRHFVSLGNFRMLLMNTLILSNAFYFTSIDFKSIDLTDPMELLMSKILLKLVAAYLIIHWTFYRVPRFFMRIYFHLYVRNKYLKWKKRLEQRGRFRLLRETHELYRILSVLFRNYIYNLGYFTRNELRLEAEITEETKEELLNDLLMDCYKWMCCLIHLVFTMFFIWDYANFWLILIAFLAIVMNFAMAYSAFPIIMNLELLNKIRLDLLKDRKLGTEVMEVINKF